MSNGSVTAECLKECYSECMNICKTTPGIFLNKCHKLCINHCQTYDSYLDVDKTKCFLLCNQLNLEIEVCNKICEPDNKIKNDRDKAEIIYANTTKESQPINYKDGCIGFGREVCYKACRLHEKESIDICLCACCKCKF